MDLGVYSLFVNENESSEWSFSGMTLFELLMIETETGENNVIN